MNSPRLHFITIAFLCISRIVTQTFTCSLTGQSDQDPYPSLSKCYRYNNAACCNSVHDDYINNYLSSLLTNSCMRKYSELEDLMCFGCHPLESHYIDRTSKTIRMCLDFALRFWNATTEEELNRPTKRFDNCGFKKPSFITYDQKYIIPSQFFGNLSTFFDQIQIPFYDQYTIVIEKETSDKCYNKAHWITINAMIFSLVILYM